MLREGSGSVKVRKKRVMSQPVRLGLLTNQNRVKPDPPTPHECYLRFAGLRDFVDR